MAAVLVPQRAPRPAHARARQPPCALPSGRRPLLRRGAGRPKPQTLGRGPRLIPSPAPEACGGRARKAREAARRSAPVTAAQVELRVRSPIRPRPAGAELSARYVRAGSAGHTAREARLHALLPAGPAAARPRSRRPPQLPQLASPLRPLRQSIARLSSGIPGMANNTQRGNAFSSLELANPEARKYLELRPVLRRGQSL